MSKHANAIFLFWKIIMRLYAAQVNKLIMFSINNKGFLCALHVPTKLMNIYEFIRWQKLSLTQSEISHWC